MAKSKAKTCQPAYKTENRAKVNKAKKLARHLKRQPNDAQASAAEKALTGSGYTGRVAPNRKVARTMGSMSLNRLSGRLSAYGREAQAFMKMAKVVRNESECEPKAVRDARLSAVQAKAAKRAAR